MNDYSVQKRMTTDVIVVTPDMEIRRAVHLLLSNNISGVPVVDSGGRLVGMLTERDCIGIALHASYHDEPGGTVAKFMTTEIQTVTPDTSLIEVAEMLVASPHRRFPVIEDGRLVGLITRHDVLRELDRGSWFRRKSDHD